MSLVPNSTRGGIGNSVFKPTIITVSRGVRFYGQENNNVLYTMTNWKTFQPTNVANITQALYTPVNGVQWKRINNWVTATFALTVTTTAAQATFTLGGLPIPAVEPEVAGTVFTGTGSVEAGAAGPLPVLLIVTPATSATNVVVTTVSGNFGAGTTYVFRGTVTYLTTA